MRHPWGPLSGTCFSYINAFTCSSCFCFTTSPYNWCSPLMVILLSYPCSILTLTFTGTLYSQSPMPQYSLIPVVLHPSWAPQAKLPKLSTKKFNGGLTKWDTFWDSYNPFIQSNTLLFSVDKFNYLTSLVEATVAEATAGLTITLVSYEENVAIQKRFSNPQLIVSRHMESLLRMSGVLTTQH